MLAATPNWRSAPAGATRITEAWHNTQRFSPSVSWAGSISTISSSLPTRISESAYRKIPLMLKSRVIPVAGWPCDDRMETPVRAIMRWRERRSDLGSDMKVEGYHTPAARREILHFESDTATNAPRPISVSPVAARCLRLKTAEDRRRAPIGAAMNVTMRSQEVFNATLIVPSRRNCQNTLPLARSTNCGMKARKKIAVLGFKTSVAMPCQKGFLGT